MPTPTITIRRAATPADDPAIAAVLTAESPAYPTTPADLAHAAAVRGSDALWIVLLAEDAQDQTLVGIATAGHNLRAFDPHTLLVDLRVRPDRQGQGVGKRLYAALLDQIEPLAPRQLMANVWAAHERAVQFAVDRGFAEQWRRIDSRLDVQTFDPAPFDQLEARLGARGVATTTYAALAADPQRLIKLHALDQTLWQDVPYGQPVTPVSFDQWRQELEDNPDFLPDACFIATHNGAYIGYSCLLDDGDRLHTDMTGVLHPFRSLGVATALKLHGIRYAQTHGQRPLETVNDSSNAAMLALNAKLGFEQVGATIRFVRNM